MTAQSLILPADDGAELRRWALAAAIVFVLHVGAVGAYLYAAPEEDDGMSDTPAVFVDLTPMSASSPSTADLPPGQESPDAQQIPKPPDQAKPEVAEPVQKVETQSDVQLPVPEDKVDEQKPQQEEQAPSVATAPPRADQVGPQRPATAPQGSTMSRNALIRWNHLVSARLQQNKRYPAAAARGEQGTVTFAFVVNAKGEILSKRIVRSSGHPTLDDEAMAMLQRAQPLPAFLPGMTQPTLEVSQSIGYTVAR
jgi:periplasmic protein TonB